MREGERQKERSKEKKKRKVLEGERDEQKHTGR